jgi:hypothetical protein
MGLWIAKYQYVAAPIKPTARRIKLARLSSVKVTPTAPIQARLDPQRLDNDLSALFRRGWYSAKPFDGDDRPVRVG